MKFWQGFLLWVLSIFLVVAMAMCQDAINARTTPMVATSVRLPVIPRNDYVLIRLDNEKTASNGGILLPAGAVVSTGTVLDVGPGARSDNIPAPYRMPIDLKVGSRVFIGGNKFGCTLVDPDGDDRMILIPEQLVLGTIPNDAAPEGK